MSKTSDKNNSNNAAPDFKLAADILQTAISQADDDKQKALGDLSAAWKDVEKKAHVNKRGAKFIRGLLSAGNGTASDILRTVVGLCNELDIGITKDMVDEAQGVKAYQIPLINTPSVDA